MNCLPRLSLLPASNVIPVTQRLTCITGTPDLTPSVMYPVSTAMMSITALTLKLHQRNLCFGCHQAEEVSFTLASHHPLKEGRVFCVDCHDPHGTFSPKLLKADTVRQTCVQCHTDKQGPFLYEHADVMDNCSNCHSPHGSVNPNLLSAREPFLCLQCHEGHYINERSGRSISPESARFYYTRCTDCHSTIHGSDTPSESGRGRFTQ